MIKAERRAYSLPGFVLVVALHWIIFLLLLRHQPHAGPEPAPRYSQLLILLSPRKPAGKILAAPPKPIPARLAPPSASPVEHIEPSSDTITASPAVEKATPADDTDPFNQPTRFNIDDLVKQAGKADRETRPAGENRTYGPATNSMEAVLTRAFTEAKLAVPPKWYEAARIEPLTPPDARKPIYQVKTAFGTYCLFYPDRLSEGTGQPRIAPCPRSFGR